MDTAIAVERRDDVWWVVYGGTILFIGEKADAVAKAKSCANTWRVEVSIEKVGQR